MFLQRRRRAPIIPVNPQQRLARQQTQRVHHVVHFDGAPVPRVDPVHAVERDARARAVDVIDEEFPDEHGCVGVALADARDHFAGAHGDFGDSGDGEGLGGFSWDGVRGRSAYAEEGEVFAGEKGPGTFE